MGKHRIFRALFIRTVFVIHSLLGVWLVTEMKNDNWFWYLCIPLFFLMFETVVTLSVRKNLEWTWFCPSVFLYLASIVPAIWLLELDKVERRIRAMEEIPLNYTTGSQLKEINTLMGVQIKLPDISLSTETWITLIEQFLMLILIIGRWMLPKGDLTRDQLSQLLLVYIGTAADIIEFFDSFKDDKIASEPVLVLLTLGIWSWSLMQFTVVLTATKSRKSRLTTTGPTINRSDNCCTIDVCSILLNITLQDAPFLAFRLLLILHYKIISYMNVFFTCKNTLVILLQIYRLYVVHTEHNKKQGVSDDVEVQSNISIISRSDLTYVPKRRRRSQNESYRRPRKENRRTVEESDNTTDTEGSVVGSSRNNRKSKNSRKDTGYSTASSHASVRNNLERSQPRRSNRDLNNHRESLDPESRRMMRQQLKRSHVDTKGKRRQDDAFSEESDANYLEDESRSKDSIRKSRGRLDKGSVRSGSDQSSD